MTPEILDFIPGSLLDTENIYFKLWMDTLSGQNKKEKSVLKCVMTKVNLSS